MRKAGSAPFPLNLTYPLVKKYDREANDGLVTLSSAKWGDFLGNQTVSGRRGISHGDIIDLMREDIDGFDVREFYVSLVKRVLTPLFRAWVNDLTQALFLLDIINIKTL